MLLNVNWSDLDYHQPHARCMSGWHTILMLLCCLTHHLILYSYMNPSVNLINRSAAIWLSYVVINAECSILSSASALIPLWRAWLNYNKIKMSAESNASGARVLFTIRVRFSIILYPPSYPLRHLSNIFRVDNVQLLCLNLQLFHRPLFVPLIHYTDRLHACVYSWCSREVPLTFFRYEPNLNYLD